MSVVVNEPPQYVVTITETPTTVNIAGNPNNVNATISEETVSVVSVGTQGPIGPQGQGADKSFTQSFTFVSTLTVTHNLGKRPAVTVIDSAGDEVEGTINHVSLNALTLTFSAPFSGIVILN